MTTPSVQNTLVTYSRCNDFRGHSKALRDYQLAPTVWFAKHPERKGLIVQYDTGTGKTLAASNLCRYMLESGRAKRVIIITLTAVRKKFEEVVHNNCMQGMSDVSSKVIVTTYNIYAKKNRGKQRLYVVPEPTDLVIVDEAHKLRNYGNLNKAIIDKLKKSGHLMFMTATPIVNTGLDMMHLLQIFRSDDENENMRQRYVQKKIPLSTKEYRKTFKNFNVIEKKFPEADCQKYGTYFLAHPLPGEPHDCEIGSGRNNKYVSCLMFYMHSYTSHAKDLFATEFPSSTITKISANFNKHEIDELATLINTNQDAVKVLYSNAKENLNNLVTVDDDNEADPDRPKKAKNLNAFLTKARQFSDGIYSKKVTLNFKKLPTKVNALMITTQKRIEELHQQHRRYTGVIIYSQFLGMLDMLVQMFVHKFNAFKVSFSKKRKLSRLSGALSTVDQNRLKIAVYTGSVNQETRKEIVEMFNRGEIDIILISQSGVTGTDFKNVRYIDIIEPYMTPSMTKQIIGRGVRFKSHEGLQPDQRHVLITTFIGVYPPSHTKAKNAVKISPDERIWNISDMKSHEIAALEKMHSIFSVNLATLTKSLEANQHGSVDVLDADTYALSREISGPKSASPPRNLGDRNSGSPKHASSGPKIASPRSPPSKISYRVSGRASGSPKKVASNGPNIASPRSPPSKISYSVSGRASGSPKKVASSGRKIASPRSPPSKISYRVSGRASGSPKHASSGPKIASPRSPPSKISYRVSGRASGSPKKVSSHHSNSPKHASDKQVTVSDSDSSSMNLEIHESIVHSSPTKPIIHSPQNIMLSKILSSPEKNQTAATKSKEVAALAGTKASAMDKRIMDVMNGNVSKKVGSRLSNEVKPHTSAKPGAADRYIMDIMKVDASEKAARKKKRKAKKKQQKIAARNAKMLTDLKKKYAAQRKLAKMLEKAKKKHRKEKSSSSITLMPTGPAEPREKISRDSQEQQQRRRQAASKTVSSSEIRRMELENQQNAQELQQLQVASAERMERQRRELSSDLRKIEGDEWNKQWIQNLLTHNRGMRGELMDGQPPGTTFLGRCALPKPKAGVYKRPPAKNTPAGCPDTLRAKFGDDVYELQTLPDSSRKWAKVKATGAAPSVRAPRIRKDRHQCSVNGCQSHFHCDGNMRRRMAPPYDPAQCPVGTVKKGAYDVDYMVTLSKQTKKHTWVKVPGSTETFITEADYNQNYKGKRCANLTNLKPGPKVTERGKENLVSPYRSWEKPPFEPSDCPVYTERRGNDRHYYAVLANPDGKREWAKVSSKKYQTFIKKNPKPTNTTGFDNPIDLSEQSPYSGSPIIVSSMSDRGSNDSSSVNAFPHSP